MGDLRAELAEWQDKWSDLSQNADPGQREDSIIYLQDCIIASLDAELAELKSKDAEHYEAMLRLACATLATIGRREADDHGMKDVETPSEDDWRADLKQRVKDNP